MDNKWSLVIHETTQTKVRIWVGTLFPIAEKPEKCCIIVTDDRKEIVAKVSIIQNAWKKTFKKLNDRFYIDIEISTLLPNTIYQVEFIRCPQNSNEKILPKKTLSIGSFKTLPNTLSQDDPFVVALGSCFYHEADNGNAASAYRALYFDGDKNNKPDVKFLTGDQVYLDVSLTALIPLTKYIRKRIANNYATAWQKQGEMLKHGATWFLADDHEYWDNFPYTSWKNLYQWMLIPFKKVKSVWAQTAKYGVKNIQKVSLLRTFNIGNDLSVCFADLRSKRGRKNRPDEIMPALAFNQLIEWAESLTCPGIIVLSQPLLANSKNTLDLNITNYPKQYERFLKALACSGHDIVCLSGDVHFGRIAQVEFGQHGAKLHEIIASPMSNLTGVNAKIAETLPVKINNFPLSEISGVPINGVQYDKNWAVTTERVKFLRFFSYKKTKEHFMTLAFTKTPKNKVKIEIQAWRIREINKKTGLPKPDFITPHQIIIS